MSTATFQILTQLYGFLSQFEADDILAVSRRGDLSQNLREALHLLAKERRTADEGNGKGIVASVPATRTSARYTREKETFRRRAKPADPKRAIREFLLDPKRFPNKLSLAEFAVNVGVPEAANSKYSRERVAHYIARRAMADESFARRLVELAEDKRRPDDSQSTGWMDLILRR